MHDLLLPLAQEAAALEAEDDAAAAELARAQTAFADDVAKLCETWFAYHDASTTAAAAPG